ncbi:related to Peroxisomal coenzyme A diphosphatase 1, peroxisomal [Nakaseomyces glabratus]|nr:related to Peroxisomal coenzyme A diphosphatase 1, peroxisomal [Nakaseomyces glabratus]SLM09992.1 related to Peroxisomal coenzyme A diphosphatase 1, peroxisomal [Nakaseomyces glabratus]
MLKSSLLLENIRKFNRFRSPYRLQDVWPLGRRSAVLVLLFIGNQGELRVLLTKRSRSLRSFSGHVSFPGGKADDAKETPEQVARRETCEEIGLPQDAAQLKRDYGMEIENLLTEMPCYISRTLLSVKPVVCLLKNTHKSDLDILEASKFAAKLNPGETSSLFSVHCGTWHPDICAAVWQPKNPQEAPWLTDVQDLSSEENEVEVLRDAGSHRVQCRDLWGLTAKIISDLAAIATGLITTDTSRQATVGHEDLIYGLYTNGQMQPERSQWESDMIRAKRDTNYTDVIPEAYMSDLHSRGVTF